MAVGVACDKKAPAS